MSTKKVKARKMWAPGWNKRGGIMLYEKSLHPENRRDPIFVLPATPDAYEQMVEQIHAAISKDEDLSQSIAHHQWLDLATLALAALGIHLQPKKTK